MTRLADVRCVPAPSRGGGPRGGYWWVCPGNPFYALSAMLVCLGLWVSFGSQAEATQSWALLVGMAGYTLLLAATASLLVRFVGAWDDARTVMLLVVLMILATSVTFDVVLARDPGTGVLCYLVGLAAAVVISEGMLRGVRLALPPLFRVPYYLSLALFFLYPAAIAPLVARPKGEALSWALFGFSPAAGLVCLTLVPAVRRGRGYVRDNGSPWRWAWYPWTLFGVLGFAVVARSALLCWSMHHLAGAATEPYIFGFYFLAPFLTAVGVVLLEIGIVEGASGATLAALAVPPVMVVLAMVGHRPEGVYQGFLGQFAGRLGGTPLYLTVVASAAFYGYAALRRVPLAVGAFAGAVGALAFVAPATLDLAGLTSPRAGPLVAVAAVLLGSGLRRRDAWRCLLGAFCLIASVTIVVPGAGAGAGANRVPIAFHLAQVAALVVGAVFRDAVGRALRVVGATMALVACLAALSGRYEAPAGIPAWAIDAYPLVMAGLVAGYGYLLGERAALGSAGVIASCWVVGLAGRGYGSLRHVVTGLDYIAVGMLLFALAVATSLARAGVPLWRGGTRGKVPEPPV